MSKILFISNLSHEINSFATASITAAHCLNMDYYHASNWGGATREKIRADELQYKIKINDISISRNPFAMTNLVAFKQLVDLIKREEIDYIHCNTPTGGLLGRLVGKKCKVKRVIYQAHGFHFYKGAPKRNWILYYPIEKWMAHYTDALITINQEDYEFAKAKLKLREKRNIYYVPGVGIDTLQFHANDEVRERKRNELGIRKSDIVLISVGDLIERKNYNIAIRAIAEANNSQLKYFICGKGPKEEELKKLVHALGISEQIHFLGFRSDVKQLLLAADIFVLTTKQEGLPRSMMEAMASGLPCIASKVRGNTDLLEDNKGGMLCEVSDIKGFAEKINVLANDSVMRQSMGWVNLATIQKYNSKSVSEEIRRIYATEFEL